MPPTLERDQYLLINPNPFLVKTGKIANWNLPSRKSPIQELLERHNLGHIGQSLAQAQQAQGIIILWNSRIANIRIGPADPTRLIMNLFQLACKI